MLNFGKLSTLALAAGFSIATTTAMVAQTVGIGTAPQGSVAYTTAVSIAEHLSEVTDMNMRVIPQGGPVVTIPLVNSGELEFSVSNSIPVFFAQNGGAMFKDRPQPGALMVGALYNLNVGFFVHADSDIQSISDLKGRKVAGVFTKQKGLALMQKGILATEGLTVEDVVEVPVPSGVRGVDDFIAGKIDAGLFSVTSGKVLQADASVGGIRWLPINSDADSMAAMTKFAPGSYIETLTPAENRPGIDGPTPLFAGPFLMLAGANTSEDMVYEVTKALYEGQAALAANNKTFGAFSPKGMAPDLGIQIHPGALRFYREVGLVE